MAYILNIETATTNCSVSVAKDGKTIALREDRSPNYSHSELLHAFMDKVVKEAGIVLQDLNAIAVSKGPGSYTGLRIGVSAAKGLCYALELPLISIATLASMAQQIAKNYTYRIPVLDARRMEVYAAVFGNDDSIVQQTTAEIITESSFASLIAKGTVMIAGSGAEKCMPLLGHENVSFDTSIMPSAKDLGHLAYAKFLKQDFEDVAYFEPYYLKDFVLQGKTKK